MSILVNLDPALGLTTSDTWDPPPRIEYGRLSFDPGGGTIALPTVDFTVGVPATVGLTSTSTTRSQVCDSWCLSGLGYTSTWVITPSQPWAYVNACQIEITPIGGNFSIYSCLYDPSGTLVACAGDQSGNQYTPTPSSEIGMITGLLYETINVVNESGATVQAVILPSNASNGSVYTMSGGNGSGYTIKTRTVRDYTYLGDPAKIAYVTAGDISVQSLGTGYGIDDVIIFPDGTPYGTVTNVSS